MSYKFQENYKASSYNHKTQKGQALLEFAIVSPLLLILLLGVGYLGHTITSQQNLNIAARFSARNVSIESTKSKFDRTSGAYVISLGKTKFLDFAKENLQGVLNTSQLDVSPPIWPNLINLNLSNGSSFVPAITGIEYAYIYKKTGIVSADSQAETVVPNLQNMKVGVGTLFFGARVTYNLKELDIIAKLGLQKGLTIQASSIMPAELPLRGTGFGLMDINPWIKEIINDDVNGVNYPSLFKE